MLVVFSPISFEDRAVLEDVLAFAVALAFLEPAVVGRLVLVFSDAFAMLETVAPFAVVEVVLGA